VKSQKCPWTMVYDTREQSPWLFEDLRMGVGGAAHKVDIDVERGSLKSGDYSIKGYETRIAIERKSAEDLFGTLGRGRERFVRELARLDKFDFSAVVVESEWWDMLNNPPERSKVTPAAVNGTIVAFQQRFTKTHWWFCPGRYVASKQAYKILDRWYSDNIKG